MRRYVLTYGSGPGINGGFRLAIEVYAHDEKSALEKAAIILGRAEFGPCLEIRAA